MMNALRGMSLALLASAAVVIPISTQSGCKLERRCDGTRIVNGSITRGKSDIPVVTPHTIEGELNANVFLDSVTVGGARATNKGENYSDWTVDITAADLEEYRGDAGDVSVLPVVATDICGSTYQLDTLTVPLGPNGQRPVAELDIARITPDDCYVPVVGSAITLKVSSTDLGAVGAQISVAASAGTFAGATSPVSVTLAPDDASVSALLNFTPPPTGGTVVLSARGNGPPSPALQILVADPPEVTPSAATLPRGVTSEVMVRSRGILASCVEESTEVGAVAVSLIDPRQQPLDGITPVGIPDAGCAGASLAKLSIVFTAAAHDGAQVTIRCSDTFGQEGKGTFTVQAAPP